MTQRRDSGELDGRTAAVEAVTAALQERGFVADILRGFRAAGRLDSREAGLAMEIGLGATRHAITSEHVLRSVARYDPRRVRPGLRAAFLAATYQIIWMDRVPVFAAVDESVSLARRRHGPRAAGMINAVLRRLTGSLAERRTPWQRLDERHVRVSWSDACSFKHPVLPSPDESHHYDHLAAATGEHANRYRALCHTYGDDAAEQISWASQAVPPLVLHANSLRIDGEGWAEQLRAQHGEHAEIDGLRAWLPPTVAITELPLFHAGRAYVQDTTAHVAATAVDARPGERVLDLCAAPGGKSMTVAIAMSDRGEVIACDVNEARIKRVRDNAARLGLASIHARMVADDPQAPLDELGMFDAALVDAPCSNSGVVARRPEARLRLNAQKLRSLVMGQVHLLDRAAAAVRPGGRLVYSTCSIEPDENEQVVATFLEARPDWQMQDQHTTLPAWGPALHGWRDGGYLARLTRKR